MMRNTTKRRTQQLCCCKSSRLLPMACACFYYFLVSSAAGAEPMFFSVGECVGFLASLDQGSQGDGLLLNRVEYSRMVADISHDQLDYSGYSSLHWELQEMFDGLAETSCGGGDRCIDLNDDSLVDNLCSSIELVFLRADFTAHQPKADRTTLEQYPTTPALGLDSLDEENSATLPRQRKIMDDPSPPVPDCSETIGRSPCDTALSIADLNRDNLLNEQEYVRFVNRLSGNAYAGDSFADLPANIQENFHNFATTSSGGQVNITGSKPWEAPTDLEDIFLDKLCCLTDLAIEKAATPTRPPSQMGEPTSPAPAEPTPPTMAPDGLDPTLPPTFLDALCRTAMASSDFGRDDYLSQEEYVRFLNRLTRNEFINIAFEDLEVPLPQLYAKLASETGEIYIYGSKPGQDADPDQDEFITEICLQVAIALSRLGETFTPTEQPSNGPSDMPSTIPSDGPSLVPSTLPSDGPSWRPSTIPSDGPSLIPSMRPSLVPSDMPSLVPTNGPSSPPTIQTVSPSTTPSLRLDDNDTPANLTEDSSPAWRLYNSVGFGATTVTLLLPLLFPMMG